MQLHLYLTFVPPISEKLTSLVKFRYGKIIVIQLYTSRLTRVLTPVVIILNSVSYLLTAFFCLLHTIADFLRTSSNVKVTFEMD